jgi:hypothetical protein
VPDHSGSDIFHTDGRYMDIEDENPTDDDAPIGEITNA